MFGVSTFYLSLKKNNKNNCIKLGCVNLILKVMVKTNIVTKYLYFLLEIFVRKDFNLKLLLLNGIKAVVFTHTHTEHTEITAYLFEKQPIVGTRWMATGTVMTTAVWRLCQRRNFAHEGHISCSTREEMSSHPGPPTARSEVSKWAFVTTLRLKADWSFSQRINIKFFLINICYKANVPQSLQ